MSFYPLQDGMTWSSFLFVPPFGALVCCLQGPWGSSNQSEEKAVWVCCLVLRVLYWEGGILLPGPSLCIINLVLKEKHKDINDTISSSCFIWMQCPQLIFVESSVYQCVLSLFWKHLLNFFPWRMQTKNHVSKSCLSSGINCLSTQILSILHFCRRNLLQPSVFHIK